MRFIKWLNLQFFADGAAASGGDGAPGESAAAAGQNNALESLGVPQDRREKWAKSKERRGLTTEQQTPAKEDSGDASQSGMKSWEDILKVPEYKQAFDDQVSKIVKRRLSKSNEASETLSKLAPALEFAATKYGLDTEHLDYTALAEKIMADDSIVEDYADQHGTSIETAREAVSDKLELARLRRKEAGSLQQQQVYDHINRLHQQAEEVKAFDPDFDVDYEIANNAAFARMTSPQVGLSVADAYFAVHRKDILAARDQAQQKQAIAAVSSTIRAGQSRPVENGATSAGPISAVPYSKMSKADRLAFKNDLKRRWANGEKPTFR